MYAIVDIETTGGQSTRDKITEIAVFVYDGEKVVDSFVSLINPERPIPYFITQLTGISDDMVADAPKFYEVAKRIVEITEGCTFVAHNVNFDYHFIRNEFKSLGYPWQRKRLCTVRLSRRLLPGHRSYSLGRLTRDLGITISDRHRAAGDAEATVKLFRILLEADKQGEIFKITDQVSAKSLPPHLDKATVDRLPEECGVYYFFNRNGTLLYVGKSNNIKKRVMSHLRNDRTGKAIAMIEELADIDFELTGSELVALLKESHEIKTRQPRYNVSQRRVQPKYGLVVAPDLEGFLHLKVERISRPQGTAVTFFSKSEADNFLGKLAARFELCQSYCGQYAMGGACFGHTIKQCRGTCIGQETAEEYNQRVQAALGQLNYQSGNMLLVDKGCHPGQRSVVLIENGHYRGFGFVPADEPVSDPSTLTDYIDDYPDNRDIRQIIHGYLRNHRVEQVIEF